MEFEEAGAFFVEDIVKSGKIGAEAFGESLAWQGGEISEGVKSPEEEDFEIFESEVAAFDEFIQRQGEGREVLGKVSRSGRGVAGKRGEVSEVRGGSEGGLHRESEVFRSIEAGVEPIVFG